MIQTQHPTSPLTMLKGLVRHRQLIWQMTKREVVGRYRGSIMGLAWSFFNPILMLLVYTFVFSVVFKMRWGAGAETSKAEFAIVVFVGMIVHGLFAECVNRAPGLILSNTSYVKKVVFPLEILPWVAMGSALFHTVISLAVLLIFYLIITLSVPSTAILFPLVIFPLVWVTMGCAWFLSATGVFVRDIAHTTGILTTVLMFMSPVFYPMTAVPEGFRVWLLLNPLTFIIEEARNVLIWGQLPNFVGLAIYAAASVIVAWIGFWWFQKTRKGFADVM